MVDFFFCFNSPNFATNCKTILSPATAQRTSKAKSSYNTSQFNFDWKKEFTNN